MRYFKFLKYNKHDDKIIDRLFDSFDKYPED